MNCAILFLFVCVASVLILFIHLTGLVMQRSSIPCHLSPVMDPLCGSHSPSVIFCGCVATPDQHGGSGSSHGAVLHAAVGRHQGEALHAATRNRSPLSPSPSPSSSFSFYCLKPTVFVWLAMLPHAAGLLSPSPSPLLLFLSMCGPNDVDLLTDAPVAWGSSYSSHA